MTRAPKGLGGDPPAPANDTSFPSSLPVGGTFENSEWRVHRYSDSVVFTHLANAGVRGKKCMEIHVRAKYGEGLDRLDLFVSGLLEYMALGATPTALASLAKDAPLLSASLETVVSELRGVDVEMAILKIETDLVKARFSSTEFSITVTALMSNKHGAFRQDSHLYNADKRSVPKAYRWARENAERIGHMTRQDIYSGLVAAGARVSTWG
ncbi:MAG: hypothetical protein R3B70_25960 [Polyangiaceae bacterium]